MEPLKREKIGGGVYFNSVSVSRFKTMKITVSAYVPASKDTASEYALLSDILTRSTKEYPTLSLLEKKLLSLYGAELSSEVKIFGDMQVISLTASGLDERYAFDNTAIASELSAILCGALFEPNINNGAFDSEELNQSKRQIYDSIDAEFSDKRTYSVSKCVEIMCSNSPAGVNRLGDKESVNKVTEKSLYSAWRRLLKTARFEIMYVADTDSENAKKIFSEHFNSVERKPAELETRLFTAEGNIKEVTEEMELAQSKLVMGFETGLNSEYKNYPQMMLLSAVLGGTPSSKLFMNVREKQSLCYYCISRYNRIKGYMIIESGVETANLEKARCSILEQLQQLKDGNITDFEISAAKLAMTNSFRSVGDTVSGIESWYLSRITEDKILTPEETAKQINAVTKEQLVSLAQKIKLDTVYTLKSKE
ncbi:MAG: EF-P 5-aminopentanol modification-associated protein YfmF [Ruminococcus sp.]